MVIAVNTRFLLKDKLERYGYFIKEVFSRLTQQHPDHRFYFLFDRPYAPEFIFSDNVTPLVISPTARYPLLWKYWYDVKVPLALRNIKADVFVSPDGLCSLTTRVPQCLVVHDLGFLHYPDTYRKSHLLFYKWYTPKFLKKAKSIATVARFSKNDMIKRYAINAEKIDVVYGAAKDNFQPISLEQQTAVKEKYTEGKEYFIYVGAIHLQKNIINLLKAFSIFKKRQRSSMKLVLCGWPAWRNDAFLQLLKTYKYRNDVPVTGYVAETELVHLIGSAYALVYPSLFEGFGMPVLEALQCRVPVLTSAHSAMQEISNTAALYFDAADPASMADQLMLIYKDEDLRRTLIEKGRSVAKKYSWQRTAELMWACIEKAGK
ncbi:MAG: glycosyltransferase family 4 protein [Bacteroidota bacterium]|nr:glycosyltransferase family 4 protein [Flavisolibacter sp.]MBD0350374.1 glycosyltransferase family 4 protein [Flavisolibacter sp.]MDQ3843856.1 glycosyltransferase family 4 protein [Bacteroidota bacterium]